MFCSAGMQSYSTWDPEKGGDLSTTYKKLLRAPEKPQDATPGCGRGVRGEGSPQELKGMP